MKGERLVKNRMRFLVLAIMLISCYLPVSAATPSINISGWSGSYCQVPNDNIDSHKNGIKVTTDRNVVEEGNGALRIFIEQQMDGLNYQAVQNVPALETGKKYVLTGRFSVPVNNSRFRIRFGSENLVNIGEVVDKLGEWADFEYEFEFNFSNKNFTIQAWGTGDLYADNVSLREILYEEDGETVSGYGDELLVNGNFEDDLDLTPPSDITDVSVSNLDSGAVIKWINPQDEDFEMVYVYSDAEGVETFVGSVTGSEYTISGLTNNETYNLILKAVDATGNISTGVAAVLQPIADAVKYTSPTFYINDVVTDAISEGTLKASMQFKNNRMPEDYSVELILVLLKDGALSDIKSNYIIVSPSEENRPYTELSVEIDVPEGDGYSAELYVWDSITGMEAVTDAADLG